MSKTIVVLTPRRCVKKTGVSGESLKFLRGFLRNFGFQESHFLYQGFGAEPAADRDGQVAERAGVGPDEDHRRRDPDEGHAHAGGRPGAEGVRGTDGAW